MTSEEGNERRLLAEAQTVRLGNLIHQDVTDREAAQRVRVEVTYQLPGEVEHAGFYLVYVPEIDPAGLDDDAALAAHPATLATDTVHDWVDEKGYDYFSIDEAYPA